MKDGLTVTISGTVTPQGGGKAVNSPDIVYKDLSAKEFADMGAAMIGVQTKLNVIAHERAAGRTKNPAPTGPYLDFVGVVKAIQKDGKTSAGKVTSEIPHLHQTEVNQIQEMTEEALAPFQNKKSA